MKLTKITFEGVKGVGSIQLDLSSEQQVFTFIGVNGIGKTKLLESLFQFYLLTYKDMLSINIDNNNLKFPNILLEDYQHNSPVIFIASQNRGFIKHNSSQTNKIFGNFIERKKQYLKTIFNSMQNNDFTSLNMDTDIEQWFVTLA
jgi:ABC-type branched-subunit amino acid transport system ATPase component